MKFLAIDTSGEHLSVILYHNGHCEREYVAFCARTHSVILMEKIQAVFSRTDLKPDDMDFFAVTVGAGSFTGIRIGLSTIKGLAFAVSKQVVPITSFDCLAYAENSSEGKTLAVIDALHGNYYICGYENGRVVVPPAYSTGEEVQSLLSDFKPVSTKQLFEGCKIVDPCDGLLKAVLFKRDERIPAEQLAALYLRKSSAEEQKA